MIKRLIKQGGIMAKKNTDLNHKIVIRSILSPALTVIFVVCMVISPKNTFEASITGLKAWWNIVFPALLPFFIGSELLMSFGVVQFMGVLLEPIMRPLFNLPGSASFVMAMGFTSGYPISSILTAKLRNEGLCTRYEGERLMSFTNNASPLFMLGAVAVGMYGNQKLGPIIAISHYLASITLGLILRYFHRNDPEKIHNTMMQGHWFKRAFNELIIVRTENNIPIGKVLGDAVTNSVQKLLTIGGFIIIFAVLIKLLSILGIIKIIIGILSIVFKPLGFSESVINSLGSGFFEITLGCKYASESTAPLVQKLVITAIILAWSGLSVHAQVISMVSHTDLKTRLFIICRLFHGILAGIFTWIIYKLSIPYMFKHETVWFNFNPISFKTNWFYDLKYYTLTFILVTIVLLICSILFNLLRNIKFLRFYSKK